MYFHLDMSGLGGIMEKGLNFRTQKGQEDYFKVYDKTLQLWDVTYREKYIKPPLEKLTASCYAL